VTPSPSASDCTLKLERPLVCVDLETTGVNLRVDRVIQIGLIKIYPDERETQWKTLVNPGITIPPEATQVHGIGDEDVQSAPPFREIAHKLAKGLTNCDIIGFNVKFDVGFLVEEMRRAGIQLGPGLLDGTVIDAFQIFMKREPRTLSAAVNFYLGEKAVDAHDALADSRYALRVLMAQIERYDLPRTVEGLASIFNQLSPLPTRHGEPVLNFGKWSGTPLSKIDRGYLEWIMQKDFKPEIREKVAAELKRRDA